MFYRMSRRTDVLSWDDYFMSLAFLSSQRSKDPATQILFKTINISICFIFEGWRSNSEQSSTNHWNRLQWIPTRLFR